MEKGKYNYRLNQLRLHGGLFMYLYDMREGERERVKMGCGGIEWYIKD